MKKIVLIFIFLFSGYVGADTLNCRDLYVGVMQVTNTSTIVVFKNAKGNASGSYAQNFTGWTEENKQTVISLLMGAKLAGHRVNVGSTKPGGCSIFGVCSVGDQPLS